MRRADRAVTDANQIASILSRAKILHLALFGGEYPYVVPMHYGFRFENGTLSFYLHCAKEGRKLDLLAQNPHVCAELECGVALDEGGDVACNYGAYYECLVAFGTANIVEDTREKCEGLALLMKHQTGRDFPVTEQMAQGVCVLRVDAEEYTAKARPKPAP
ncbi:MAG: pyridoxamine 5'-phosphate oxidase family protein [Oscillibacter sp.]|nr:pyridoxamine 5'-phosphate oxidase family protein [Oscillibacter sp.]